MIVLVLSGGLGNQMFEYAAAKAMALRSNTQLVINNHLGFERDKVYRRVYSLGYFNVSFIKRRLLSFDFPGGFIVSKISRKMGRHIFMPWYKYVVDNQIDITNLKAHPERYRNVILSGAFILPEFFDDYREDIIKDFSLKKDITPIDAMQHYISVINDGEKPVVALCARIYQEIKNETLRKNEFYAQGVYYNNAIEYYKQTLGDFRLFIFTQAKDWVRENVNLTGIDYEFVDVSRTDKDAAFEMLVLSHCHHYIISNSSYYFWGVYLNNNDSKTVIIPKGWEVGVLKEWKKL